MRNIIILIGCLLAFSFFARANDGKKIYQNKCATCHDSTSESRTTPFLHGQEKRFLIQAINDFRIDKRTDHIMNSMNNIAKTLTEKEIEDVTAYLAAHDPCVVQSTLNPRESGWIEKFREGQRLVTEKNCLHCHGSFHHAAPRLYGQKKSYLDKSIELFREDKRPGFFKMIDIAKSLSDDEIDKMTHYLNGMILMRDCHI